jgi:hypothetical protein
MGLLVDQLGSKVAGELIRSQDWNALVAAVEGIETALTARIDAVDGEVEALGGRVTAAEGALEQLETAVAPLLGQFRVNLRTTKLSYALGEAAEITADVRDLSNNPIAFTNETRPWVDFVTAWGQLKAVGGFESLGGAGDRAISVRTNAQGEARVILRGEIVDSSDELDDEISASLTTQLAGGTTVAQAFLAAGTPAEAKSSGAFTLMTQQYDQPAAKSVRSFVDSYYVKNSPKITGILFPPITQRWRDYRATVIALAKNDSDPLTPDAARGVSSLQVTFRDWIGPWILLDYVNPLETIKLVPNVTAQLIPKITGDIVQSTILLKDGVKDVVRTDGLVGKLRDYQVVSEALDQLSVPQFPDIVPVATKAVKQGVTIQQSLETAHTATIGLGGSPALDAFAETSVKADSNLAAVKSQVTTLQQTVGKVDKQLGSVQEKVGSLDGKVTTTLGTTIQKLDSELKTVNGKVEVLRDLDPTNVRSKLIEIEGISNRLSRLEQG